MNRDDNRPVDLELRAASGPTAVSFRLHPPSSVTIGRRSSHALQLNDPAVSRDHARLSFRPGRETGGRASGEWLLGDLGSTHGTWLNGVPIRPNRQYHLRPGDLLVIGPWTFLVVDRAVSDRPGTTLATVDEAAMVGTIVARMDTHHDEALSFEGLRLLQGCSEQIHAARTEASVVDAVLEAATTGTDFTRASFLRPMTAGDVAELVSSRGQDPTTEAVPRVSRALIREAANGSPARLLRSPSLEASSAAVAGADQLVAICVPIMVESTLVGFLYLDVPWNEPRPRQLVGDVNAFLLSLARLAALGMANLMRLDIERRHERIEAELVAAAEAQRWLRPQRDGRCGPFSYVGETRQGQYVGGDFFDILPLAEDRLAVIFGDVGGKGIPVSVLVSASQGFLHACMEAWGDPVRCVESINRLYVSRIAHSSFLKLWIGVLDASARELTYVAAGHGCAMTVSSDGRCELLATGSGVSVGIKSDAAYQPFRIPLTAGSRLVLLSDGFVEQKGQGPQRPDNDDEPLQCFGVSRVQECLGGVHVGQDEVESLFATLSRHAGAIGPEDDATAVVIRW